MALRQTKVAKLHQHPESGAICALSSDGVSRYVVRNAPDGSWSCTCPGFNHYGHCYHCRDAARRFPGFFARPLAVIHPADPESEPPSPAAARRMVCSTCSMPLTPETATVRNTFNVCADRDACIGRSQRIRAAYRAVR